MPANIRTMVTQLKEAVDKIAQVKANPEKVQQAVSDAKHKIDELVKQAEAEEAAKTSTTPPPA
jgi:phage shock protein A